jgi:putative transposase
VARYRFITEHRAPWGVEEMCKVLEVSRGGYYDWKKRPPSQRAQHRQRLDAQIKKLFGASKKRFGSPKITQELMKQGWRVSESHVARRMRQLGLRSIVRRRFRVTTDSKHRYPVAPNLLQRNFTAQRPNQVWVSDLTYLRVGGGWLYLVVFIDLYSRRVVGWALSSCLDHTVVLTALQRAVARRQSPRGLVIHSDRGVQYACTAFTKRLARHGFVQSMSRKGDCWDNAVAESFFHLLKTELVYHCRWLNHKAAHRSLFEYIEIFYNRERSHSTLDYVSPDQFEQQQLSTIAA